jgi:tungstate transport system permease protein
LIWDAFVEALRLIWNLDHEVMEIAWRSLRIAATSSAISFLLIALPLGTLIHFNRFPGKPLVISTIQTLFAMPAVVVGLLTYDLLSNKGAFGELGWYLTPDAIVFGQTLLITPVMLGLVISALNGVDKSIPETATTMGASRLQTYLISIREARFGILTALVMGFGRAISEVGISIMVGGNIRGYTRTLTTTITLETQMGELELAHALGIILILLAFVINLSLLSLQYRESKWLSWI